MSSQSIETRGAWLFRKMSSLYGARFLDMWRDVDMSEAEAEWTNTMRGMPRDALQRGVAALYHAKNPPTLPEFLELFAEPRPVPLAHQFRIEEAIERTDSPTARAKLAGIAGTISLHPQPGIAWAQRIVEDSKTKAVPALKLAIASEAIRKWEAAHPMREREPGDDDEEPEGAAA